MVHRWRSVLAVFVATLAVAAGVVILVVGGQHAPPSTSTSAGAAGSTTRYTVGTLRATVSARMRAVPAPSMRVTATRRPTLTVDSGCRLGAGSTRLADVPPAVGQRI